MMSDLNFWQYYKYDVEIHVGTLVLNTSLTKGHYGLCDKITINRQENTASNAIFTFIPPEAIIALDKYQSQKVTILFRTKTDGWQQVFTGFVDVPSLDFINRKVTLQCTDDRNNQIIKLPKANIENIGYFSETIFGTPTDQSDELNKRLQTVNANFDFNRFGLPTLTSWTPKTSADFTIRSKDVRQNTNPSVIFSSRKMTTNTVNIVFKYSYQRLHQQSVNIVWPGYSDFLRDYWTVGKPSFPQRSQIQGAANVGNWQLINPTSTSNITALWPAQGFPYSGGTIIWQPNQVINSYAPETKFEGYEKDSTGNFVTVGNPPKEVPIYAYVVDKDNNRVMQIVAQTVTDTSSALCRGAQWTSATKFAQTVTEIYNINIVAPQSVTKYGTINSNSNYNLTDGYDTSTWEDSSIASNVTGNFFIDQATGRANLITALQVAYYKARHDILDVHRDIQVQFQTVGLRSTIDLVHTIDFNVADSRSETSHISAKGKVSTIAHTIDFRTEQAYTDITISLSRSDGSSSTDLFTYTVPTQNPSYIGTPQTISLPTHAGVNPDPSVTNGADKWTGWICNREITTVTSANRVTARTNYQEQFIVDYPAIPDSLRNEIDYSSVTNLNIAIPNDSLETST